MFRSEESYSSMQNSAPSAPVTVGAEYDTKIEDTAREGDGIARVEGFVIFVPETQVGDQVKIQIDRVMRRFAVGHKV
jgi:predicted RNA-binding protein with TRAM domain